MAWLVAVLAATGCTDGQVSGASAGDTQLRSETSAGPASGGEPTGAGSAATTTSIDPAPAGPGTAEEPVDISDGSVRWARISGGTIYLEGRTTDQAEIERLFAEVSLVAGDVPVVNNLVVDPSSPAFVIGFPIYIEDVILFDVDSAEIQPQFIPLLDIGARLLIVQPSYTVTIEAHADATGPSDHNLALSQRRADAVRDYVVAAGVPEDRVIAEGLGETGAETDASPEQQAAERRVEFFFNERLPTEAPSPGSDTDAGPDADADAAPLPPTTVGDG
ncbi:MAG: OmpA family protein [Acidimicrobiales bacterium]